MMNHIGMINLQSAGYVAFKQSFSVFKNKAYLKLIQLNCIVKLNIRVIIGHTDFKDLMLLFCACIYKCFLKNISATCVA